MLRLNDQVSPEADSFGLYRDLISELFVTERASPELFSADLTAKSIGSLFLHSGYHGAAIYDRAIGKVRSDGLDDVAVMRVDAGQYRADFDGIDHALGAGDMVIIDRSRPLKLDTDNNRMTNLNLPRTFVERIGFVPDDLHGQLIKGNRCHLISANLNALLALDESEGNIATGEGDAAIDAEAIEEGAGLLVASLLLRTAQFQGAGQHDKLFSRAASLIRTEIENPQLSVHFLSNALGVSRASLYRAFADHGGVRHYVNEVRLRFARYLLRTGRVQRVSSAAIESGFTSLSHFSSMYHKRFSERPSTHLRGTIATADDDGSLLGPARLARWNQAFSSRK